MTTEETSTSDPVKSKSTSRFLMFFTAKMAKTKEFKDLRRENRNKPQWSQNDHGTYIPVPGPDAWLQDVCEFNVGGVPFKLHWAGERQWMMVTDAWRIASSNYFLTVYGDQDRLEKDLVLLRMFDEREDD